MKERQTVKSELAQQEHNSHVKPMKRLGDEKRWALKLHGE